MADNPLPLIVPPSIPASPDFPAVSEPEVPFGIPKDTPVGPQDPASRRPSRLLREGETAGTGVLSASLEAILQPRISLFWGSQAPTRNLLTAATTIASAPR